MNKFLKLIGQGHTFLDKLKILWYLIRRQNNHTIKMDGPNRSIFLGVAGFDYTIWHNFLDYDSKVFKEISKQSFDNFIDIGANVGKYSIILKKIQPDLKVVAFEPVEKNRKVFKENCTMNNINIEIKDVALSNKVGTANLFLGIEGSEGSHSLIVDRFGGSIEVKTDILDNYGQYFTNNTLIKIDVEGAEVNVLFGGKELINKFKPILLFESHSQIELNFISQLLEPMGYIISNIENVNYIAKVYKDNGV